MNALLYVIPFLIFAATLGVVLALYRYASYAKTRSDLLRKIESEGERKEEKPDTSIKEKAQQAFFGVTEWLGTRVRPKGEEELTRMRMRFLQAGLGKYRNMGLVFYGSKVFFAILLPALFLFFKISLLRPMLPIQIVFVTLILAFLGFYIPDIWLHIKISKRKEEIIRGFPDALDLMVICAEAGMGLDAAINRVGDEMQLRHPRVSEEFRLLTLELRAGKMRREALKNFAMRTNAEDIESFVTLLIQTDKFGTSIAQALRVQADSMRTKRTQKVEEIAAKLPVKLLFPTILFIFPSMFLVLAGPALLRAFRVWMSR